VQASSGVRLDHYAVTCMKRGKIARLLADSVMGANHDARAERRIDLTFRCCRGVDDDDDSWYRILQSRKIKPGPVSPISAASLTETASRLCVQKTSSLKELAYLRFSVSAQRYAATCLAKYVPILLRRCKN
jgi:hypothetical protein